MTNARWQLGPPRGDQALIQRMTTVWQQHRPTGERLEAEAEDRAQKWKQQHTTKPKPAPAPDDLPLLEGR